MQVFRDNTDMTPNIFLQKGHGQGHVTPNFSTPPLFEAPLGEPLRMSDDIWQQKTRIVGLPDGEKNMTLASFLRFDTIPARDRQTDRRTDTLRSLLVALA